MKTLWKMRFNFSLFESSVQFLTSTQYISQFHLFSGCRGRFFHRAATAADDDVVVVLVLVVTVMVVVSVVVVVMVVFASHP